MLIPGNTLNRSDLRALQAALSAPDPAGYLPFDLSLTWAWREGGQLVGYAAALPVPGLPALFTLHGGVLPAWRRRGIGRQLLAAVRAALPAGGRLECGLPPAAATTIAFLRAAGFVLGHEELFLRRSLGDDLPALVPPAGWQVATLPRAQAGALLRRLYDASFGAHPWYQPFPEDESVTADLADPAHLLFGLLNGEPVGFAWLWPGDEPATIEPFGVLPAGQGRGLGAIMLAAALARLQADGVRQVSLGAWRDNERALGLYRRLGFTVWYERHYWLG